MFNKNSNEEIFYQDEVKGNYGAVTKTKYFSIIESGFKTYFIETDFECGRDKDHSCIKYDKYSFIEKLIWVYKNCDKEKINLELIKKLNLLDFLKMEIQDYRQWRAFFTQGSVLEIGDFDFVKVNFGFDTIVDESKKIYEHRELNGKKYKYRVINNDKNSLVEKYDGIFNFNNEKAELAMLSKYGVKC